MNESLPWGVEASLYPGWWVSSKSGLMGGGPPSYNTLSYNIFSKDMWALDFLKSSN